MNNNNSSNFFTTYSAIFEGHQWILNLQTVFLLFTTLIAIVLNVCFVQILKRTSVLQTNVKCFLLYLTLAITVHCFYIIGQCLYNFMFLSQIELNEISCECFQFFQGCCTAVINLTTIGIAIDQLLATYQIETGKLRNNEKVSVTMYSIIFIISIIGVLFSLPLFFSSNVNLSLQPYCHFSIILPPLIQLVLSFLLILLEIIGFVLYLIVYFKTKRHYDNFGANTAKNSLPERYQLNQTLNTVKSLLKWSIFQVLQYLIGFSLRVTNVLLTVATRNSEEIVIYSVMVMLQFYCIFNILHPILLLNLNATVGKLFMESYPIFTSSFWLKLLKMRRTNSLSNNVVDYRTNPEANNDITKMVWSNVGILHRRKSNF